MAQEEEKETVLRGSDEDCGLNEADLTRRRRERTRRRRRRKGKEGVRGVRHRLTQGRSERKRKGKDNRASREAGGVEEHLADCEELCPRP